MLGRLELGRILATGFPVRDPIHPYTDPMSDAPLYEGALRCAALPWPAGSRSHSPEKCNDTVQVRCFEVTEFVYCISHTKSRENGLTPPEQIRSKGSD